jgi:hypothetical protein
MSGIQRPFPGVAPVQQQPSSSSIAQLANTSTIGMPTTSSYLTNYPTLTSNNTTFIDDQTNLNRHFPNLEPIDLGVPTQFQITNNLTNSFYPTQRTHTSPSATASFPQLFGYVPPSFNHHHHHHLSSNVDDASLLIQNPSLT